MWKKLLMLVIACVSTSAFAQQAAEDKGIRPYIQAGISGLDLKVGSTTYDIGSTATGYAGIEVLGWLGLEVNTASALDASGTAKLDFTGAYLRPFSKISDDSQVFFRYGSNNITLGTLYGSASRTFAAYGVGANWYFGNDKSTYLQLDYMVWGKNGNTTLSGIGLSVGQRF
jgi:hypothetical protein